MRLSDIKGEQAFKTIGAVVGCLRELFKDEKVNKIVQNQEPGWILDFFSLSLEGNPDVWMKMYLLLNPDVERNDVSIGSVIKFAYEFKNDPELMTLFFSQSDPTEKKSTGSLTENTEATDKT